MSQPTGGAQSGAPDPTQSGGDPNQPGTQPPAATPPADPATQSGQPTGQPDPNAQPVSRAEYEALQARMRAADQRAAAAEKKIKDAEDAQLSEADKIKKDLEEERKLRLAEKERNDRQAVDNAVLADTTYAGKWHNIETVLGLVDRSMITLEDGKPKGVKAALDKLAKDHAYLLKPAEGTDNNGKSGSTGATGTTRQQGGQGAPSADALAAKFPAMRGRVPRT